MLTLSHTHTHLHTKNKNRKGMLSITERHGGDVTLGSSDFLKLLIDSHSASRSATTGGVHTYLHQHHHSVASPFSTAGTGGVGGGGGDGGAPAGSFLGSESPLTAAVREGGGGKERSGASHSSSGPFVHDGHTHHNTNAHIHTHAHTHTQTLKTNTTNNNNNNTFNFPKTAHRLLKDPTACSYVYRISATEEYLSCSPLMEELFMSTAEMRAMQRQFKMLCAYIWCTFLIPEDRGHLMRAIAVANIEKGSNTQIDTTVRCVSRQGEVIKCLASVAFHADGEGALCVILRLLPLGFRSLAVLPVPGEVAMGEAGDGGEGESSSLGKRWKEGKMGGKGLSVAEKKRSDEGTGVGERESEERDGGGRERGRDDAGAFVFCPIDPPPPHTQQEEEEKRDEEAIPPEMWQYIQEVLAPL
jgi:hypothetical protein